MIIVKSGGGISIQPGNTQFPCVEPFDFFAEASFNKS
jgi:hypothetical protein